MKKTISKLILPPYGGLAKTLNAMKIAAILLFIFCSQAAARSVAQTVTLSEKDVPVIKLLNSNGPDGMQWEWNVKLDPLAYACLMKSGLTIYSAPCFSQQNLRQTTKEEVIKGDRRSFNTYYIVPNQEKLLESASDKLKNYFSYALNKRQSDPINFLSQPVDSLPENARNMWSTASFFQAAGRRIYLRNGQYRAYSPEQAPKIGIADKEISVYEFKPVTLSEEETTDGIIFKGVLDTPQSNIKVFRYIHPEYNDIMVSVLSQLLGEL